MPQYFKRKISKIIGLLRPFIKYGFILACIGILIRLLFSADLFLKENNISKQFVKSIIFNTDPPIRKFQNRTNIAILGIMGGNSDGADLTDTIVVLSLDYQKKDAVFISLPRDIWMENLKDKINSAYHYGEIKKNGGGLILAKSEIEEITGQPIHYAVLINLSNFEKIIDLVGGIDLYIDQTFTDNFFPIPGMENDFCSGDPSYSCRYEKLTFIKGWMHMNGITCTKYIRSRQAEGNEGTDFARSKRQQKVILALKDKLLTFSLWKNPAVLKQIVETVNGSIITDMNLSEKITSAKFFLSNDITSFRRVIIDNGDRSKNVRGFLENPPVWKYKGVWVLVPRTGNFDEIHSFITCNLKDPSCPMKP